MKSNQSRALDLTGYASGHDRTHRSVFQKCVMKKKTMRIYDQTRIEKETDRKECVK